MRDKIQTIFRIQEMIKSHRYDAYTDCVLKDVLALLGAQESVVHCKDCIYRPTATECRHDDDWFCANGERAMKQDGTN